MDRLERARGGLGVGRSASGLIGAHAAGVRARVAVAQPLVVAGGRQARRRAAVAQGDDAGLAAVEPLLDDHAAPGLGQQPRRCASCGLRRRRRRR